MQDYHNIYIACLWIIFSVSALAFPASFFYTTPYGRHKKPGQKFNMPYNLGWFIMEIPPITVVPYVYFKGQYATELAPLVIFFIWMSHYTYRSLFFPFLLKGKGKTKPVAAVMTGFIFNSLNGFGVAYGLGHVSNHLTPEWLTSPNFIVGVLLMVTGFYICYQSDAILRNLRKPGETGYKIPTGGFYKWVSSPNYLGEIIEWSGFAILCWNLPALAFLTFTISNLFPRSFSHHRWFKETFLEYPKDRKAIIPFIV